MRLNKRLSELGICSRREADRWIEAGRITVNGRAVELGTQVEEADRIELDGRPITKDRDAPVLLMYHKPRGIICTSSDKDRGKNVIEAINYPVRIYPIGRLDKDSEGLLLLTNQGDLHNQISHARNIHEKEYIVTVDKDVNQDFLDAMKRGVYLRDLDRTTRSCEVWQDDALPPDLKKRQFHIVLTEGLNRQIRRMCSELGFQVRRLKRIRIMELRLGNLKLGEYREIDISELGL